MSVEKVAVIGAGLMGHGIAQVVATSGQEVTLMARSDESLARATRKIEDSLSKLSAKGRIQESPGSVLKRIKTSTNFAKGVSDADLVIETVLEDIALKKKILSEADANAPKHAILATNTSGLSITVMAEATNRREKVIGMHWLNPPQLMRLVEIVKTKYTGEDALKTILDLSQRYGKETIVVSKDVWFFLAARAHSGWVFEANLMYLRKEAEPGQIDAVGRYKLGLPMGPFELMDFIGFVDIRSKSLESAEEILKSHPEFEPWPAYLTAARRLTDELWRPMTEKGLSGVRTGKGFYTYPEAKYVKPEISQKLAEKMELVEILAPAINVAAWCVTNGVGDIASADKAVTLGYGWPKGPFQLLDELGADNIAKVLRVKQERAPDWLRDYYELDPLITRWKS